MKNEMERVSGSQDTVTRSLSPHCAAQSQTPEMHGSVPYILPAQP